MELTNDVAVRYEGSLVAREEETDWLGDWIIEGSTGVIKISHHQLKLIKDSKVVEGESFIDDLYLEESVKQFIDFLDAGNKPSSSAEDYIKTQALIDFAAKSSTAGAKIYL
jgi:predicted dehydrogenase